MQPGANPQDIHSILNRFNHWAGKQATNGNGHPAGLKGGDAEVREIPYEEMLRRVRARSADAVVSPVAVAAAAEPPNPAPEETPKPKECSPAKTTRERKQARKKTLKASGRADMAQARKQEAAPPKRARNSTAAAQTAQPPQFRQVLAKSVREATPVKKAKRKADTGRGHRVSVRLSQAEERQLQSRAAEAGLTVSEYLRMCALGSEIVQSGSRARIPTSARHEKPALESAPETARPPRSGLGDWIALLRNRFLASPIRFAERA
jgi:hypothetical protein